MMKILAYIFFAYLYISVGVFIYFLIRDKRGKVPYNPNNLNGLSAIFSLGTLIMLWLILSIGIEKFLLAPIPYSWGWHEGEGVKNSLRFNLAWMIALAISVYIFWIIGELQRKEKVIKELQARYQKLKGTDKGECKNGHG
ncbi:MAG: hypothetical protein WC592_02600 [Candidatus Omnitrophota bacterium]